MTAFSVRRALPGDAGLIVAMHELPHVRGFLSTPSVDQVRSAIDSSKAEHVVVLVASQPAGFIMFAQLESWLFEIRRLIAAREGLGIASHALAWALDHIFDERRAHRVYLEVSAANVRARQLYERRGFIHEGTYRDGFRNPKSGAFEDLCVYGMLADEHRARREASRSLA